MYRGRLNTTRILHQSTFSVSFRESSIKLPWWEPAILEVNVNTYSVAVADFSCGVIFDGVTAGAVSIEPGGRVRFNLFLDILLILDK